MPLKPSRSTQAAIGSILAIAAAWLSVPWVNEFVVAEWKKVHDDRRNANTRGTPFPRASHAFFQTQETETLFSLSTLPTGSREVGDNQAADFRKVDGFYWSWAASGFIAKRTLGLLNEDEIGIIARPGSPIRAMATGIVCEIGNDLPNTGIYLKIKTGDEITSNYLVKNGDIKVKEGRKVNRGDIIAVRMDGTDPLMVFIQIARDGVLADPTYFLPPLPLPPLQTSP